MRVIESAYLCPGWSQVSLEARAQIWSRESQVNQQWTENYSVLDSDNCHEGDKLGAKGKNKGTSLDDVVREGFWPGFDPWVAKIPWKRERLPTPVFLPGEFHGPKVMDNIELSAVADGS